MVVTTPATLLTSNTPSPSSSPSIPTSTSILAQGWFLLRKLPRRITRVIPLPMASPSLPTWERLKATIGPYILQAANRLTFSLQPSLTLKRLRRHQFSWRKDGHYIFCLVLFIVNLSYISSPPPMIKLAIVLIYTLALFIPLTSQFFLPATPIFTYLLQFWSAKYFALALKPHIWVSVLPTLESVLYGANISDILTRHTNPTLDILAWIPYGIMHFVAPFVVAAVLFIFGPIGCLPFFARVFGYMNFTGVVIQMLFPNAPPWYELTHGLIPAEYSMGGSPGGLARIDALFHSNGYTITFSNAPVPFGAFPSLHAGCSTMEALFLSHFFPAGRPFYWLYVFWLYWSTMYLTHHYLIDLVAGGALSVAFFSLMMTPEMRHFYSPLETSPMHSENESKPLNGNQPGLSEMEAYELHSDDGEDISSALSNNQGDLESARRSASRPRTPRLDKDDIR